ncbi:MAG: DegT/DnrJ/EryC1/StrS aminotransferase family protein, partial [Candidatus Brocadiaceae bacterium]|nr:DegT/DnrJ/EryC1/StrS aminotransferase family protein [Candidatus Brocadiaceae bacterium]
MFQVYRPAGNRISLKTSHFGEKRFAPYRFAFYQSGTAALSAAIAASIEVNGGVAEDPEIILPAYACPDLVSAVLYAGAKPVLVDLEEDSSYLSLDELSQAISVKTVAIIAVNFLGISERVKELRAICEKQNLLLIVDSAQWFPVHRLQDEWSGDFNIISFGRGKPVNLLHGGAVITSDHIYHDKLQAKTPAPSGNIEHLKQILKIIIYNIVIQPVVYGVVTLIPGLNIGTTIFRPLKSISAMKHFHTQLIERNMSMFNNQHRISLIHKKLASISNHILLDLLADTTEANNTLMLRYP